jgi:hypothetical protein
MIYFNMISFDNFSKHDKSSPEAVLNGVFLQEHDFDFFSFLFRLKLWKVTVNHKNNDKIENSILLDFIYEFFTSMN